MTLNTLEKWTEENWSKKIVNELYKLKKIEPSAHTKENLNRLLNGEVLK